MIAMKTITGFPPIIHKNSKVLILGSMPSEASLAKGQYYGNPRNQFWQILGKVFSAEVPEDYQQRLKFLKTHGIALWDMIGSCRRRGSADAAIQKARVNDIEGLLREYPGIRAIFCNGGTSFRLFAKHCTEIGRPVIGLPSSSPAHARSVEWKAKQWQTLEQFTKR